MFSYESAPMINNVRLFKKAGFSKSARLFSEKKSKNALFFFFDLVYIKGMID